MCKLIIFPLFLFMLFGNTFLFSEELIENDCEQSQSSTIPSDSPTIIYNGLFYDYRGAFSFSNGSTLSYNSLKKNLSLIPENEKFIRRADRWRVVNYLLLGTTTGIIGGLTYSTIDGGFMSNERTNILLTLGLATIISGFASEHMVKFNIIKAINNYNLTVMGIPVRYR